MKKSVKNGVKGAGIAERIKDGWEGSMRSLERLEAEGERLLKSVGDFAEKYVPEGHRKAVEDLARDAMKYLGQINAGLEENTKKIVERLNIPSKNEFDEYNKRMHSLIEETVKGRIERLRLASGKDLDRMGQQMKKNVEEQTLKVFDRLNIATRRDVDQVAREVKKLRKDLDDLLKPKAAKKSVARKKTAK